MTEQRLDRIEAQQERNTNDIGDLISLSRGVIESVQTLAGKADSLIIKIDESNQRFETLRAEAQADRLETRQLWSDAVDQMNADRAESARRFDAAQETIQRLLLAIVDLSRDNNRLRDRVDGLEQRAS